MSKATDAEKLNALANVLVEFDLVGIDSRLADKEASAFEFLQISTQQYLKMEDE